MEDTDTSALLHAEPVAPSHVPLHRLFPTPPRKVVKKCFWWIVLVVVVWAIGASLLLHSLSHVDETTHNTPLIGNWSWASWVLMLPIGLLAASGYEILYHVTYFYDLDGENVVIRKGVIMQHEITLPISKIVDVYVDQDLLDVAFCLYDLHISTPTAESGKTAHIDGISRHSAAEMRRIFLEKIKKADASDANAATP